MANQIRPLARLFRGMADLIDHDHTSHTRYEAIAKAAGVVAARATAEELVAGRLWQVDGADLLASAFAFHAGLPRQAATATHLQAMQQPGPAPAGAQRQPPVADPTPPGRAGMGNPESGTAPPPSPASSIASPVDPGRPPGTRLGDLDPADAAKLWALLSDLRGRQAIPGGQLIWLTGWLPADLAVRLLRLLDGGPELVGRRPLEPQRDRPQRPDHAGPGRDRAGLAGGRRAGPGRRGYRPGAAGAVDRGRSAWPARLAATTRHPSDRRRATPGCGRRAPAAGAGVGRYRPTGQGTPQAEDNPLSRESDQGDQRLSGTPRAET